ncbi:MAG: DUF3179 domain-containing protein [Chloroflexi bacterium]|nr:DUF3179 domain-containing protein [Chloroflexota bacterium]
MARNISTPVRKWLLVGIASVLAVLTAAGGLFVPTNHAHAQLSCDDPPFDVTNIQRVWDLTDFCTYQEGVYDEIISGGVGRDGIPPIDNPEFESSDSASEWLQPQSPVIAVEIDGDARAYPLAIMTRHEVVNDMFGDLPVAVTFCPLCNSAMVFERSIDGQTLRLGVSGLLRNSDLIMWDDVSQTWWQQLTGEGIVGRYTGRTLTVLPSQVVGFEAFAQQYPDGTVLAPTAGRDYGRNPYVGYDTDDTPFLFLGEADDRLFPTARVLAGVIGGEAIAYPFEALAEESVVNDTVGGFDVIAIWQPGAASALDQSSIDDSRDVGMAALYNRELNGEVLTFFVDDDGLIRDEATNSVWNVFGTATEGELAGSQLRQMAAAPHFWFAWAAFRPETGVYGLE